MMPEITINARDFVHNALDAYRQRKLTCFDIQNRTCDTGCYFREPANLPCIIGAGFGEHAPRLQEIAKSLPDSSSIKTLIEKGFVAVISDRVPVDDVTAILTGMQYRHDMMLDHTISDAEYYRHQNVMKNHLLQLGSLHSITEDQDL